MNSTDVILVGIEQISASEFVRLEACIQTWRQGWGLTLTTCLRMGSGRDAFVLIAERTYHEALEHLESCLRTVFPQHVIVLHPYVQGYHLPVYTMDGVGMEQMDRHRQRVHKITAAAYAGQPSPLLPVKHQGLSEVANWREWNHVLPAGKGSYLICDACGESTARQDTEDAAWQAAEQQGWQVVRESSLCFCVRCIQNGNATAATPDVRCQQPQPA